MSYLDYVLESTIYSRELLNDTCPSTITFKSSTAGRKIELSTDGGVEYFQPSYTNASATMLVVTLLAPVTHVKVTGSIADTFILVN